MSSLQLALAVAGGLVIAGLVAHGAWQARRAGVRRPGPRAPAALPPAIEPTLEPLDSDLPIVTRAEPSSRAPAR